MNHAGTILNTFEAYDLDAKVYNAISVASRIAANVKNRANVIQLAYRLHELNKTLIKFFELVHGAMEGKIAPDPKSEPVTPERLRAMADNLEHLHRTIEYVFESLRRARLTNNSLTAGSLLSIRKHGEAIVDLADWFELAASPTEIADVFNRAKQQKERGELVDLVQA